MRIYNRETSEIQIVFRQNDSTNTRVNRNGQIISGKGYPLFFNDMDSDLQNFLDFQLRRFDITAPRPLNQGETKYTTTPTEITSDYNTEFGNTVLESYTTMDMVFNKMVNDNGTFYPYTIPAIGLSNGLIINKKWNIDGTRNPIGEGNFTIGLGGTINKSTDIKISPFTKLKISSELGRDNLSPKEFHIDIDFKLFDFKIDPRKWTTTPDPTNLSKTIISTSGITYYALNPFVNTPYTLDDTLTTQVPSGLIGDQYTNEWYQDIDTISPIRFGDDGTSPLVGSSPPFYSQKWRLPSDYDVISWDEENLVYRPRSILPIINDAVEFQGPLTDINVSALTIGDSFNDVTEKFSYIIDLIAPNKPELLSTSTWSFSSSIPSAGFPPSSMSVGSSIPLYLSVARHTKTNLLIDWTTSTGFVYGTLKGLTGSTIGMWNDNMSWTAGFLYTSDWSISGPTASRTLEESRLISGSYSGYTPYQGIINGVSTNYTITGPIDKRFLTSTDIVFNTGPALSNSLATGPANPYVGNASLQVVTSNIYNKIWIQLWNSFRFNLTSGPDPYYVRMASYIDNSTSNVFGPGYRLFSDSSPLTPIAAATGPLVDIPVQNINWVSGVPTLGLNSQLRGAFNVTNFAKWFYPASTIATISGTLTPNDGLDGANLTQTDSRTYSTSTSNQYITGSYYRVDNTVVSLTDNIPNTISPWLSNTVQTGRWSYPFSFRVITTGYNSVNTSYNSLISPTGPSEIIIDTVSDNTNSVAYRVTSGDSSVTYPTFNASIGTSTFGAQYTLAMHQNSISSGLYIGELQLRRNLWTWPTGNWSNLIPTTGPDYSSITTPTFRYATFRIATGLVSITSYTTTINKMIGTFVLDTNNQITTPSSSLLKIEICMVSGGSMVTPWFDLNKAIIGTPSVAGDGCLFSSGSVFSSNNLTRIISFGPSPKTGDLYMRIGIRSSTNISFKNVV